MKLNELLESQNTTQEGQGWIWTGNFFVNVVVINNLKYQVIIEPGKNFGICYINLGFKIQEENTEEEFTTKAPLTNKKAPSTFGIIYNLLKNYVITEFIPNYDCDAILFFADDNIKKKMSIYNRAAKRDFSNWTLLPNIETTSGNICSILYKPDINTEHLSKLIDTIKTKQG